MNIKKRCTPVLLLLILTLVLGIMCNSAFAEGASQSTAGYRIEPLREKLGMLTDADIVNSLNRFSDTSKHWGRMNIGKLTTLGIINGMPDGTFKPDKAVSAAEYITMIVRTLGYTPEREGGYWAQVYIDRAIQDSIINRDEIKDYELPLTREHAAVIAVKALMQLESEPNSNMYNYIRNMIPDYPIINDKHKQYVLQAYATGLFNGSGGGYFLPANTITRAEATTVMLRLLDSNTRNPMKPREEDVITVTDRYNNKDYEVYPGKTRELFDTVAELQEHIGKSKGYAYVTYNPFIDIVSSAFFESEKSYVEDQLDYQMSFSIYPIIDIANECPYLITIYQVDSIKELHYDFINQICLYLFENNYETCMKLFDKYIEVGANIESSFDYSDNINNRKLRFIKNEGEDRFAIWIYSKL